jgi:hypothetical protein
MSDLLVRLEPNGSMTVVNPADAPRARRWAAGLEERIAVALTDALVHDGHLPQRVRVRFVEPSAWPRSARPQPGELYRP